ncbi:50S ribosomal protein L44e [Candidatus Hecatella orcuttiae]|jgi:large subunit ribosomal protein L44e|uniref:50S ribosomal protein L44e n=1 Tax=Candidatus Hecatella orcuttiae TaxID=1935119 RepID=UPI002867BF18|nr:50S ribosomal protein L44e [Candidatus Hecatella orcuttiae]
MRFPKSVNVYCPRCRKHTAHSLSLYKKGKERALSAGARHHERDKHGYGGQKFPELKRTSKTTKKAVVKLTCKQCGYTLQKRGIRLRKVEVT